MYTIKTYGKVNLITLFFKKKHQKKVINVNQLKLEVNDAY